MKKFACSFLYALLLSVVAYACNDDMNIQQSYDFEVTYLPVPKKLKVGEIAEIRCRLVRSGEYAHTKYYLRYFQPDGKGELWMNGGKPFLPNDTYDLPDETFRLYYRSLRDDTGRIDIVFFDSFGKEYPLSFSFTSDSGKETENVEY
ncbi:hypothetical protein EZS27_031511 [termite gut metagenome]|uniref:DUF3872 domain-containing protein n=1 Tax=termite gut metagenome TaxID=433724 RepID=A0A5J4QC00_9ZZZZ